MKLLLGIIVSLATGRLVRNAQTLEWGPAKWLADQIGDTWTGEVSAKAVKVGPEDTGNMAKATGVCLDRSDENRPKVGQNEEPHFWKKRASTSDVKDAKVKDIMGKKQQWYLQAAVERYEKKYKSFVAAVQEMAEKEGPKGSGYPHLTSSKVMDVIGRMRGFEKCRDLTTSIEDARNSRFVVGNKGDVSGIPDDSEKDAKKITELMTEGDECCREDCVDPRDEDCKPCGPVCYADGRTFVPRDNEKTEYPGYCFERCCDQMEDPEFPQDHCKPQHFRVCKGLKSLARYARKEVTINLAFDVCPDELKGISNKATLSERRITAQDRNRPQWQYCDMFNTGKTCGINLGSLFMRGGAESKWTEEIAVSATFGGDCPTDKEDRLAWFEEEYEWTKKKNARAREVYNWVEYAAIHNMVDYDGESYWTADSDGKQAGAGTVRRIREEKSI